jgi:hypothetical protein
MFHMPVPELQAGSHRRCDKLASKPATRNIYCRLEHRRENDKILKRSG